MLSRTETTNNGLNPTPIKSSMSLILENDQTWSNYISDSHGTVASRRTHGQPGSMTRSRGDFKEWSANFSDISGFRNMDKEMFDTFAERLVQKHSTKKKRMADRKTSFRTSRNDRRTKKSRQVFTLSRPTNLQQPGRPLNEGIEIYESCGGSISYKEMEGAPQDTSQAPSTTSPTRTRQVQAKVPDVVPLPRVVSVQQEIEPYDTDSSCDTQIFIPERLLTPNRQLGTCFPRAKSQPHLYYSISDQSMPLKSHMSAHSFDDTTRKNGFLNRQADMYFVEAETVSCQKTSFKPVPKYDLSPMVLEDERIHRHPTDRSHPKSLLTHPNGDRNISELKPPEGICLGYQELNDFLSEKMAKTLTGISVLPTRGRLMSYAKFNSSFKITEEVYEDVNARSISRVPTVAESLAAFSFKGPDLSRKNFDYIHKMNPDFDENQSLTEALTTIRSPYQSSSLTSVDLRSDIFSKVYGRFAKSVSIDERGIGEKFRWIRAPESVLTRSQIAMILERKQLEDELTPDSALSQLDQKSGFVDFSNESDSCVSLSRVVSAIRQQRLTELKISLKNAQNLTQKETDLRSSTTLSPVRSDPMEITCGARLSRKKLCDVISQTGVFNNSSVEMLKRPFWRFKLSPVLDERRTKLVHDFVSKAHHYMCGKDYHRTTLNRCFFRTTPAIRLSDQSTQFPDSNSRILDRLGEIEKPEEDDVLSVETAMYCQIVHENCHLVHKNDGERKSNHSMDRFKFRCSDDACHTQTEENTCDPSGGLGTIHKHVSKISFTEINCIGPSGNSTVYYHRESSRPVQELQAGLVQPEAAYDRILDDLHARTSIPNQDVNGAVCQQPPTPVSHSFRALCDKRRIKIKYENGKYTVYKEVDHSRRRTVWSLLTGKATNLLNIVLPKKPHQKRSSRSHKICS